MTIGEVIPMYPIQGPKMDDLLSTMKHTLSNKSSVYGQVLGMLYRYVWEVILILGVAFVSNVFSFAAISGLTKVLGRVPRDVSLFLPPSQQVSWAFPRKIQQCLCWLSFYARRYAP